MKNIKYPTIKEVSALVRAIKPEIDDSYIEFDGDTPSIMLTIGFNPESGEWSRSIPAEFWNLDYAELMAD